MTTTEELHFHTREQVAQHLDDALELVTERGLAQPIAAAVLPQLIALLAGKQVINRVPAPIPIAADLAQLGGNRH